MANDVTFNSYSLYVTNYCDACFIVALCLRHVILHILCNSNIHKVQI